MICKYAKRIYVLLFRKNEVYIENVDSKGQIFGKINSLKPEKYMNGFQVDRIWFTDREHIYID